MPSRWKASQSPHEYPFVAGRYRQLNEFDKALDAKKTSTGATPPSSSTGSYLICIRSRKLLSFSFEQLRVNSDNSHAIIAESTFAG